MYKATITIDDIDLLKVLQTEKDCEKERSYLKINNNTITITAKDIIALKATINGIIKLIEAYEKTSSIIKK